MVGLLALALGACAGTGRPAAVPQAPPEPPAAGELRRERAYLVDPFEGYAGAADASRRDSIERAWRELIAAGSVVAARRTAAEILAAAPGFPPAQVLAAQADFAAGDYRAVVERLLPVGDAQPSFTASQLVLGRAAELAGDVPLAYAAFRAVATRSARAFERTGELHSPALAMVGARLREALAGGRTAEAEKQLALLQAWAPNEEVTLDAGLALAQARGDRKAELSAIKGLAARHPGDRQLLERRAELELEVGDPSAGLQLVQELADRHPGDREIASRLAAAKFRWRLSLLPGEVRETAGKEELARADFAVLLYWLAPEVRYGRPTTGRIATDVLDHPHREEIVHVVNLGLMDVDPTLHHFSPGATLRRGQALRALERLLATLGRGVACVEEEETGRAAVCDLALRCGLVADADSCAAGEPLSGTDAVELIRRALRLLGGA